jgi:hypothetical protein
VYDKWYLRFAFGELSLRDLLREINFRADLFLDIKSSTPRAADAVLELYHDNESMMPRTLVSSPQWRLLDQLADAGTEMQMYYSIGRRVAVDALLRRAELPMAADIDPAHTAFGRSRRTASRRGCGCLRDRQQPAPRRGTLSWGVDGVISDDVERYGDRLVAPAVAVGTYTLWSYRGSAHRGLE